MQLGARRCNDGPRQRRRVQASHIPTQSLGCICSHPYAWALRSRAQGSPVALKFLRPGWEGSSFPYALLHGPLSSSRSIWPQQDTLSLLQLIEQPSKGHCSEMRDGDGAVSWGEEQTYKKVLREGTCGWVTLK